MNLIINADDCGLSTIVTAHIENAIVAGKISSTTVMANMDDLKGAAALYQTYKNSISFGWHLNLTEGHPLTQSQILLDNGFYIETQQGVCFNGRKFKSKMLPKVAIEEIRTEMKAQYEALCDNGIKPTHIDGHHHIQTSLWAMTLLPTFLKEIGIEKMRRMYNNECGIKSLVVRGGWASYYKMRGIKMPDVLCNFIDFACNKLVKHGNIIELECHPGHPNYLEEEELLLSFDITTRNDVRLINYSQY